MKKASTLKLSAQLRKLITIQMVKDNDTKWTSVFDMTIQFFCSQKELSAAHSRPSPAAPMLVEVDVLEKCYVHLK